MAITDMPAAAGLAGARITWFRALRSEWIKFRSIRTSYVVLAIAVFLLIALGALISFGFVEGLRQGDREAAAASAFLGAVTITLNGTLLAQIAIGVFGVLVVTSEYSTGMIRATFAAAPNRLMVLVAKAVLIVLVTIAIMAPAAFATFAIGKSILAGQIDASWSDPGVIRAVFGASLYLAGIGVLGAGLGWILRSAAGAIATLIGVLAVLPPLIGIIPVEWVQTLSDYLPSTAGRAIYSVNTGGLLSEIDPTQPSLDPWVGFGILCAYTLAVLGVGAVLLQRKDA